MDLNSREWLLNLLWGACLTQLEKYDEAIGKIKKVIELNPNLEVAYFMWGTCLMVQGKYEEDSITSMSDIT